MSLQSVSLETPAGQIEGAYEEAFREVFDVFVENFATRGEVGASLAVTVEGRSMVNLWGGRRSDGRDWRRETVSLVYSATKGATALCAHRLADAGRLDLDAPVTRYWPEFAEGGKGETTVAMLLDHSAGVPHVRAPVRAGGFYDHDYMTGLVAREPPFWPPGTRSGYHALTFGWTIGELVRRVTGRSLGAFFRDDIAATLGLDFWIGLPEAVEPRVSLLITPEPGEAEPDTRFARAIREDPASPAHLFLINSGQPDFNSRAARAAEIGAVNGVTNAMGLAGLYAPLANGQLLSADAIARMGRVATATHEDATLLQPMRFSLGFMKSIDNRRLGPDQSCILSEAAFGHAGAGGSLGFADPQARLSFGYTMNRMGPGLLLNDRGQSLVDATYRSLGYRSNASGTWES